MLKRPNDVHIIPAHLKYSLPPRSKRHIWRRTSTALPLVIKQVEEWRTTLSSWFFRHHRCQQRRSMRRLLRGSKNFRSKLSRKGHVVSSTVGRVSKRRSHPHPPHTFRAASRRGHISSRLAAFGIGQSSPRFPCRTMMYLVREHANSAAAEGDENMRKLLLHCSNSPSSRIGSDSWVP